MVTVWKAWVKVWFSLTTFVFEGSPRVNVIIGKHRKEIRKTKWIFKGLRDEEGDENYFQTRKIKAVLM